MAEKTREALDATGETAGSAGLTRRAFLRTGAAAGMLAAVPAVAQRTGGPVRPVAAAPALLALLREPESVTAYPNRRDPISLERTEGEWHGGGIAVMTTVRGAELAVTLAAPAVAVERVHLRWRMAVDRELLVLGDAWERSYGDLGWRNMIPERVLPWYFAMSAGEVCHCYGVRTHAGALCFWQVDPEGVSLWLDVSNGGRGVLLGQRVLQAATIVTRQSVAGEGGQAALAAFCRHICSVPSLPATPVYGFNDWYYAYGKNTARQILADTDYLATLSTGNKVRPFSVVDDGWDHPEAFPDMAGLAREIKARRVRPGIWIRPLQAPAGTPEHLLLPGARFGDRQERAKEFAYDPTIPEAKERVLAKVKQVVDWGYQLVKHDFSTYELLGQWGFEMGGAPTLPGWSLADRSRTNAEVILDLYRSIRESASAPAGSPATMILGCNAVGHLGQGFFDLQRTGDDTSGKVWERTRRMGINTLAFRLPQHGTFFVQDADCVGIAPAIPWEKNRQWLDVLARSGTAVFVSPGEGARGAEQAQAMRAAFALAAAGGAGARPVSWMEESTPEQWLSHSGDNKSARYSWCDPDGAWPFSI